MGEDDTRKMKKRTAIPYALFGVTAAIAVFLAFRSSGIQRELEANKADVLQMKEQLTESRQLLGIDSMLLKGNYSEAVRSYTKTLEASRENNLSIPLRIALAKKLSRFNAAYVAQKKLAEEAADSVQDEKAATAEEIQQYDAVSFKLEKARVQLARMQQQLREKSFGEYLTFKSKKGSRMHYVGTVKNEKANGMGFALLDTGSRYQGEWKDNQRHGEGTFYWPDGEYYVGSYTNDQRNGQGTYYWPNGEKYTGLWKEDKRNGEGVFYGKDGEVMTSGIWKDDKLIEEDKK